MKKYIFVDDANENFTLEESEFREYAKAFATNIDTNTATLDEIFKSLRLSEITCETKTLKELGISFSFKLNVEENVTSYEFEVFDGLRYREIDADLFLFRLDINDVTKEWVVFEAFEEDFDIGIDLTYQFSEELLEILKKIELDRNIIDMSEEYREHYAMNE